MLYMCRKSYNNTYGICGVNIYKQYAKLKGVVFVKIVLTGNIQEVTDVCLELEGWSLDNFVTDGDGLISVRLIKEDVNEQA